METRANYALIGFFSLSVLLAAFGFVYWFAGTTSADKRVPLNIIFAGSVAGLSQGSSVAFNGLRVGEVKELNLKPDDPSRVVAYLEIDKNTPLRVDTRARLEFQGLTGVANIALVGGEPTSAELKPRPGENLPVIFADRSDFQDLLESARLIAKRADDVFERVDRIVAGNEESITRTIRNIERFSDALSNNAPAVDRFLAQVGEAATKIGPLATRLESLATDLGGIVKAIDQQNVSQIVANVASISGKLNKSADLIDDVLRGVQGFVGSASGEAGRGAFADIQEAAKAVRVLALNLDRRTAEISTGITRFTSSGLKELEGLAVDGRRTLNQIDRTLKNVERNPQQFLFGGRSSLPEYRGGQ